MEVSVYTVPDKPLVSDVYTLTPDDKDVFLKLKIGDSKISILANEEELLQLATNIEAFFMLRNMEEKGKFVPLGSEDKEEAA